MNNVSRLLSSGFPLLLLCGLLLVSFSCSSSKRNATDPILKSKSARFLSKKLKPNRVEAEWLSAKARINYKDDKESVKLTANIRLQKDSALWMNFKKLSVEGARVLITPDSIYLLDRMNKEYAILGFDYLERRFNMPEVISEENGQLVSGFYNLQQLLLGNPPLFPDKSYEADVDGRRYQLNKRFAGYDIHYWLNALSFTINEMVFADRGFERTLKVEQEDYKSIKNAGNFSYIRNLSLSSPESGDISIKVKFSRVELNSPKNIRFEIPSHYKKIQ